MADPQILNPPPSPLCNAPLTPQIINGIMVKLLQRYFSDANNYLNSEIKYVWNEDYKVTTIVIEPMNKWENVAKTTGQRPALMVKRGPYKFEKLGIDNRYMSMMKDRFETSVVGSSQILCIGQRNAEVENLAAEAAYYLKHFETVIRKDLKFASFQAQDIGPCEIMKESKEHFCVPITISYAYLMSWYINPESLIWKSTSIIPIVE